MSNSNNLESRNTNSQSDEQYKETLRNISKLYITKKFNPALELCEKSIENYKVNNPVNIFDVVKENIFDDDDEYSNKTNEKKKDNQSNNTTIPSDLLQIYLKIIEQIKPEINCWEILNNYYQDVNEIPSKILTTCSLIEVKKQNLEESKKNLKKWLFEIPNNEKQKLREKQQPDFKYYEMLIEIYVLHILVPLEEYNGSIDYLEGEVYLTMDRKKLICDKVIKMEELKAKEKLKAKNDGQQQKSNTNKNLFSKDTDVNTSTDTSKDVNEKEVIKKPKQKKITNKHQNKYDIGNAVIDGSYDPFWKVMSKFLIDKAPLLLLVILFIIIKKNPQLIRGTVVEKILKKFYETIMMIININ